MIKHKTQVYNTYIECDGSGMKHELKTVEQADIFDFLIRCHHVTRQQGMNVSLE